MAKVALACVIALSFPAQAAAHSPLFGKRDVSTAQLERAEAHHRYVARHGNGYVRKWHAKALSWTRRSLEKRQPSIIALWISAAEWLARSSGGDPWPNCPDPYDGSGGSWYSTKGCESPGYPWTVGVTHGAAGTYCGPLQFHPMWWDLLRRRFGITACS